MLRLLHGRPGAAITQLPAFQAGTDTVLIGPRDGDAPGLRALLIRHGLQLRRVLRTHVYDALVLRARFQPPQSPVKAICPPLQSDA